MKAKKSQVKKVDIEAAQRVIRDGADLALRAIDHGLFTGQNAEALVEVRKFLTNLKTGAERAVGAKDANA